eukprot:UN25078
MGFTIFKKLKIYSSSYLQAEKDSKNMNIFLHAKIFVGMREYVVCFNNRHENIILSGTKKLKRTNLFCFAICNKSEIAQNPYGLYMFSKTQNIFNIFI